MNLEEKNKRKRQIKYFFWGNFLYFIFWIIIINIDNNFNFSCEEASCYILLLSTAPLSFIFNVFSHDAWGVTWQTLLIGSIQTGIFFTIILYIIISFEKEN